MLFSPTRKFTSLMGITVLLNPRNYRRRRNISRGHLTTRRASDSCATARPARISNETRGYSVLTGCTTSRSANALFAVAASSRKTIETCIAFGTRFALLLLNEIQRRRIFRLGRNLKSISSDEYQKLRRRCPRLHDGLREKRKRCRNWNSTAAVAVHFSMDDKSVDPTRTSLPRR